MIKIINICRLFEIEKKRIVCGNGKFGELNELTSSPSMIQVLQLSNSKLTGSRDMFPLYGIIIETIIFFFNSHLTQAYSSRSIVQQYHEIHRPEREQ